MWILTYWWQFFILLVLYTFLYQIYKEMKKSDFSQPAALFLVNTSLNNDGLRPLEGEIIILYPQDTLELSGDKVFIENGKVILSSKGNLSKEIAPGEVFDFAGGSLKLVRWNNARQFLNRNRVSAKSQ